MVWAHPNSKKTSKPGRVQKSRSWSPVLGDFLRGLLVNGGYAAEAVIETTRFMKHHRATA